ncbi:MAG: hypothetical protein FWH40_10190, partial [Coriobacteriia bacterium]|nr:hypothetical protein [Coriobacteriia bacterium]
MRAFGAVLYNDLYRLAGHKARFFLYLLMVAGGIAVAVFFNSRSAVIGNIALVPSVRGSVQSPSDPVSSPYLNVIVVQEAPPLSDLVAGRF